MSEDRRDEIDYSRVNTRVREERRDKKVKDWRQEPVEQFLSYKKGDITPGHYERIEGTLSRFRNHLLKKIAPKSDANIRGVRDVVDDDIESFCDSVLKPDRDLNDGTVADRLGFLSQFYSELERRYAIVGNPVSRPLEEFRAKHDLESDRPHIPFARMVQFLHWLTRPFSRAFWLAGLKHGTRVSEVVNGDLRCLHLDHPIFWEIVEEHDVRLDPRVRDKPDTLLIYEQFNEGTEIPNGNRPGPETHGETRITGNKRKEKGGSVLPIDSEFKTALLDWLLVRPPTHGDVVHPIFTTCADPRRATKQTVHTRLWNSDGYVDSIQNFAEKESLEDCPTCGNSLIEENLANADKPGRRFRCRRCNTKHWRSIYWDNGLETAQKMTFHQARHYFSNAHSPAKTKLHDGAIPDRIRKKRIRGDADTDGDTEDQTYLQKKYEDYDEDVREPYLDGIYKFGIYESVIPAVGEGWDA